MSFNLLQAILNGLKSVIVQVEQAIENGAHKLWDIIIAVFKAEETQLMADIKPMLRTIAVTLQNAQPGLNAQNFVPTLVAASIPVLEQEGKTLAHTAVITVAAMVSHELGIPNDTGNAGIVTSGDANNTSSPA